MAARPSTSRRCRGRRRLPVLALAVVLALAGTLALGGCDRNDTEAQRLSQKARAQWEGGHYEDAARSFVTLTEIYPDSRYVESALFWAGNLYQYYLERAETATRLYQQLIVRFPHGRHFYDAKESLAALYEDDPETQHRALQIYQQLVLSPELADRHAYFQFKIGHVYMVMGRMDQARAAFRDLLVNFPGSDYVPETYYLVGYSYYLEQRMDLAVAVFRKTAQAFPDTTVASRALFFVADTLEEQGKMREALKAYSDLRGKYHRPEILERRIKTLEARIRRGVR